MRMSACRCCCAGESDDEMCTIDHVTTPFREARDSATAPRVSSGFDMERYHKRHVNRLRG